MSCPKCQAPMRNYERNGVHVDQCTECRGIFLDRGELERLIDAEKSWHGETPSPRGPQPHEGGYREQKGYEYPRRKKKESFLSELFD